VTIRNYGPVLLPIVPPDAAHVKVYAADGSDKQLTLTTPVAVDGSGRISWAADDGGNPPLRAHMRVTDSSGGVELVHVRIDAVTPAGSGPVQRAEREQGVGGTPTAVAGAGAGTAPSGLAVTGTDLDGQVNITTGSAPAAGALFTVSFSQRYDSVPRVVLEAQNAATAALQEYVTSATAAGFTVSSANAPGAATPLSFAYHAEE
jgi:hypothetical protein